MRLMKGCSGVWIAAAAAAIDQISKAPVRGLSSRQSAAPLWELPGVVAVRPTFNTGVAFSAFSGGGLALTIATALLYPAQSVGERTFLTGLGQAVQDWLVLGE